MLSCAGNAIHTPAGFACAPITSHTIEVITTTAAAAATGNSGANTTTATPTTPTTVVSPPPRHVKLLFIG